MNETTISAAGMRQRIERLFGATGTVVEQIKEMSYALGVMDSVDFSFAIEQHVRTDSLEELKLSKPKVKLDMHTLAWVAEVMRARAQEAFHKLALTDVTIIDSNEEGPPPGTKPN